MKAILLGATGMVGGGVLRELLLDERVERVLAIVRRPTGQQHGKLVERVHEDFTDYGALEGELAGYDACFFCLGVSSSGMSEADYRRVTVEYPLALGRTLARVAPALAFVHCSGVGADPTGTSAMMWARVKGEAENAILALPLARKLVFRPAFIQPKHGIVSRTRWYRVLYAIFTPLILVLRPIFPRWATTTEELGRAMIAAARDGAPQAKDGIVEGGATFTALAAP
jgi:uncharacterized protein YbjT (DUF2867 family)